MDDLQDASTSSEGSQRHHRTSRLAPTADRRKRSLHHGERRPHPQVLETMMDELEDKVRHYFLLYIKERKRRQKCEKFSYWMQQEMAANQRLLTESQAYVDSLESKFEEIRGDPDAVRDTVQRVDLMYAQIDTLIQAFAGVCSFAATREADKQTLMQCVLDYLYPCRALDARLNALYGALYYYRLGEYKSLPEQPPPPPEPSFFPMSEVRGPWIQPSPFVPQPAAPVHATKFDAALAATLEAAKAPEKPKEKEAQATPQPVGVKKLFGAQKPKDAAPPAEAKSAEPRAKASVLPQQDANASADVELKGFSVLLEELTGFKRPAMSRGTGVKLVVRWTMGGGRRESVATRISDPTLTDGFTASKHDRRETVHQTPHALNLYARIFSQCEGSPNNERASIHFLAELSPLPPKKAGVLPKIYIDVYDEKSPTALGNAQKTFVDPDTAKKSAPWQIKDPKGSLLGSINVSIAPNPLNALLPAQLKKGIGAKAAGNGDVKSPAKEDAGKPGGGGKVGASKPTVGAVAAKPELPKSAAAKPEVSKTAVNVSGKPEVAKPASAPPKPELPKPGGLPAKPDLPKPGGIEVKKPELPKPEGGGIKKPDLPKPGGVEIKKPELPKPGGVEMKKPDLPKPGDAVIKKPDLPKPGAVPTKPDLPKGGPPLAASKPDLPKTPPAKPDAAGDAKVKGSDVAKPSTPGAPAGPLGGKPVAAAGAPGVKPALAKPGDAAKTPPGAPKPAGGPPPVPGKGPAESPGKDVKPGGPPAPDGKPGVKPPTPPAAPAKPGDVGKDAKGGPPLPAKPGAPDAGLKKPGGPPLPGKTDAAAAKPGAPGDAKGAPAKPVALKPALGAKPELTKPGGVAKPPLAKPDLSKPALAKPVLAKPALAKPALAKPVIPAKPMLALAKGAPGAKPALGAKPGLAPKPGLTTPGMPPAKPSLTKAA
ncbi:hypothetical protein ACSSS7_002717 [Eimeria intestinalis]